jgi:hypothetical protein
MALLELYHVNFAEIRSDVDHLLGDVHIAFVVAADLGNDFGTGCIHKLNGQLQEKRVSSN